MNIRISLNENELTDEIIDLIRVAFKNKYIEISINECFDESDFDIHEPECYGYHLNDGEDSALSLDELLEKYGE